MKNRLALVAIFLLSSWPCFAQSTYTSASCAYHDVNACINSDASGTCSPSRHTAINGDVIVISSTGTPCTWTSSVSVPSGVGIDITGTGTPNTGGGTTGAGTSNTTIIDGIPGTEASPGLGLFLFTGLTTSSSTAKVELLTLSASGQGAGEVEDAMEFTGTCTTSAPYCPSIRVDNITFASGTWLTPEVSGLITIDDVFGVVDHNSSTEAGGGSGETPALVDVNYSAWQGVGEWGDNSMSSADTFGTAQEIYVENNSISGVRLTEDDVSTQDSFSNVGGARYVCRFNTVVNMSSTGICSAHGTAWTGRPRGQRQMEVYYNSVNILPANNCDAVNGVNGGTGYYLSNSVSWSGGGCNQFELLDIPRFAMTASPWNSCDGTQPWDQYPWSSTTACLDQPGSGAGLLYTDQNPPTLNSAPSTACAVSTNICWPNPTLDPVYEAGEVMTAGGLTTPVGVESDSSQNRVLANRDFYAEVSQSAQSSSTSPFNGTTGTGYGTLAYRPTTCTTGVGYWAIDQGNWNTYNSSQEGELFICTATNTWTMSYEPYTYPHPLDSGTSQASPPSCTPTSGVVPQTVTCTNPNSGTTVMCYAASPTTPATNLSGTGCTTGTQYTTALTISSAETLEVIAGVASETDSSVVSYTYTAAALAPSAAGILMAKGTVLERPRF